MNVMGLIQQQAHVRQWKRGITVTAINKNLWTKFQYPVIVVQIIILKHKYNLHLIYLLHIIYGASYS